MTTALIDGDIVCYRCAAASENDSKEVAVLRASDLMNRILQETGAESYHVFLTGGENYRYKYNPEYKANRKDVPKPQYLQDVREYLVVEWKASVEDGQEADDAMGIMQMATKDTVIWDLRLHRSILQEVLRAGTRHHHFLQAVCAPDILRLGKSADCQ